MPPSPKHSMHTYPCWFLLVQTGLGSQAIGQGCEAGGRDEEGVHIRRQHEAQGEDEQHCAKGRCLGRGTRPLSYSPHVWAVWAVVGWVCRCECVSKSKGSVVLKQAGECWRGVDLACAFEVVFPTTFEQKQCPEVDTPLCTCHSL